MINEHSFRIRSTPHRFTGTTHWAASLRGTERRTSIEVDARNDATGQRSHQADCEQRSVVVRTAITRAVCVSNSARNSGTNSVSPAVPMCAKPVLSTTIAARRFPRYAYGVVRYFRRRPVARRTPDFFAGDFFATAFLTAAFFAGLRLTDDFFATAFLADDFFETVLLLAVFLAIVFLAKVFFAAVFFVAVFFVAVFLTADFLTAVFFAAAFFAVLFRPRGRRGDGCSASVSASSSNGGIR